MKKTGEKEAEKDSQTPKSRGRAVWRRMLSLWRTCLADTERYRPCCPSHTFLPVISHNAPLCCSGSGSYPRCKLATYTLSSVWVCVCVCVCSHLNNEHTHTHTHILSLTQTCTHRNTHRRRHIWPWAIPIVRRYGMSVLLLLVTDSLLYCEGL